MIELCFCRRWHLSPNQIVKSKDPANRRFGMKIKLEHGGLILMCLSALLAPVILETVACGQEATPLPLHTSEYYYQVARTYKLEHNYLAAVEAYQEALKLNPDDYEIYLALGLAYRSLGDDKGVIATFNQAIKLKPEDPRAYYRLSFVYRGEEAAKLLEQAVRLKPDWGEPYSWLGMEYRRTGKYQKAIDVLQQGLNLEQTPNRNSDIHLDLGLSYLGLNNREEAYQQYLVLEERGQGGYLLEFIHRFDSEQEEKTGQDL